VLIILVLNEYKEFFQALAIYRADGIMEWWNDGILGFLKDIIHI
jgi:hypothetical protein